MRHVARRLCDARDRIHADYAGPLSEEAKTFYTEKLGFEVRSDETMGDFGGFRWLTVGPKTQPDLEIILMPITPGPMLDKRRAEMLRDLVRAGTFGFGAMDTDDCDKTYEELKSAGVKRAQAQ